MTLGPCLKLTLMVIFKTGYHGIYPSRYLNGGSSEEQRLMRDYEQGRGVEERKKKDKTERVGE